MKARDFVNAAKALAKHNKKGWQRSSLPAVVTPPEEGVVEHLLGGREPVRRHRRQLERLKPETAIGAATGR